MKNKFTITDPEEKLLVSIQFENNVNADDKGKLYKMIFIALELWEGREKLSEELEKSINAKDSESNDR